MANLFWAVQCKMIKTLTGSQLDYAGLFKCQTGLLWSSQHPWTYQCSYLYTFLKLLKQNYFIIRSSLLSNACQRYCFTEISRTLKRDSQLLFLSKGSLKWALGVWLMDVPLHGTIILNKAPFILKALCSIDTQEPLQQLLRWKGLQFFKRLAFFFIEVLRLRP